MLGYGDWTEFLGRAPHRPDGSRVVKLFGKQTKMCRSQIIYTTPSANPPCTSEHKALEGLFHMLPTNTNIDMAGYTQGQLALMLPQTSNTLQSITRSARPTP